MPLHLPSLFQQFPAHFPSLLASPGFPSSSAGKESACNAGHAIRFLGRQAPLEKGQPTHSSILGHNCVHTATLQLGPAVTWQGRTNSSEQETGRRGDIMQEWEEARVTGRATAPDAAWLQCYREQASGSKANSLLWSCF